MTAVIFDGILGFISSVGVRLGNLFEFKKGREGKGREGNLIEVEKGLEITSSRSMSSFGEAFW